MSRRRVLIVDDDPDVAEALADMLELHGHETEVAGTGEVATQAIAERRHEVALIDFGLPDTDGVALLKELQRMQPALRAFLMTGYSTQEIASRARDAGAAELLVKPFDLGALIRALEPPAPGGAGGSA